MGEAAVGFQRRPRREGVHDRGAVHREQGRRVDHGGGLRQREPVADMKAVRTIRFNWPDHLPDEKSTNHISERAGT